MRGQDRPAPQRVRRTSVRLIATSLAYLALFSASASVSAWAGGDETGSIEETGVVSTAETTTEQGTVPSEPSQSLEDPAARVRRLVRAQRSRPRPVAARPAPTPAPPLRANQRLRAKQRPVTAAGSQQPTAQPAPPRAAPLLKPRRSRATTPLDPEAHQLGGAATIWLHRQLPDPTPPAQRLALDFAVQLRREAGSAGVSWALVLAVLRGQGHMGPVPASSRELRALSRRLAALGANAGPSDAVRALTGSTSFADQAVALSHYNRAVGLYSLVTGLERAKPRLARLVLEDPRIDIYAGGRGDLSSGLVDVRVIVLIRYLTDVFGQTSVSSLHSGHRLYARPGVVSAHVYGLAVDIAALGNTSIEGHQQPGGLTEHAVESILLLPAELQPQQVISLLGLGGPSFPLSDHADHIHVGY